MMNIKSYGLTCIWVPALLFCTTVAVEETHAQDATQPSDGVCDLWTVTPACSEGGHVTANGIRLYYEVHGKGEPLLLMHGGGGSAEHFNLMLPELSKHFRVITPDSPHGMRSADTDAPANYHRYAEAMVVLLDSLGIESAHVGGWSDGAIIALNLAIHHPERVRALIALAFNSSPEAMTEVFWEAAREWDVPEKTLTMWRTQPTFTEAELAGIRAPTLILAGEEEPWIDRSDFEWQHRVIHGSKLVWIPGADHILVSRSEEVNRAILSFLEGWR